MLRFCGRDSELFIPLGDSAIAQSSAAILAQLISLGALSERKLLNILRLGYFCASGLYLGFAAIVCGLI